MNNDRIYLTFAEEQEILEAKKRYNIKDSTEPSNNKDLKLESKYRVQPNHMNRGE